MSAATKSETLFESFLARNELKEPSEHDNFGVIKDRAAPHSKSHSRTLGDHVRRKIEGSKDRFGTVLSKDSFNSVVYNNLNPVFQTFGTEDIDFVAAMYGGYTVRLNNETGEQVYWFNGANRMLQEYKNTSFSAAGRLCDRDSNITLTLF